MLKNTCQSTYLNEPIAPSIVFDASMKTKPIMMLFFLPNLEMVTACRGVKTEPAKLKQASAIPVMVASMCFP